MAEFPQRQQIGFNSVEYFIDRFSCAFPDIDIDLLHEQFLDYQLLAVNDIPKTVKEVAKLEDEGPFHVDVL